MSDHFDPYYTWLGIPPEEQPPDHYRLLGIRRFENNPEVISNALDQRMAHIRSFQTGKRAEFSQQILNELSKVSGVLLGDKKGAYDRELRNKDAPKLSKSGGNVLQSRPLSPSKSGPVNVNAPLAAVVMPLGPAVGSGPAVSAGPAMATLPAAAPQAAYAVQEPMVVPGANAPRSRPVWQNPLLLGAVVCGLVFCMGLVAVGAVVIGGRLLARGPVQDPGPPKPPPKPDKASQKGGPTPAVDPRKKFPIVPGTDPRPGPISVPKQPNVAESPAVPDPTLPKLSLNTGSAPSTVPQGYALHFDGTQHVELANTKSIASWNPAGAVEMWVRLSTQAREPQNFLGTLWQEIERDKRTRKPQDGWMLGIRPRGATNEIIHTFVDPNRTTSAPTASVASIPSDERWHHLAYAHDATGLDVFVDGKRYSQGLPFPWPAKPATEEGNLFLGAPQHLRIKTGRFHGDISAVRLSSKKRYTQDFDPPVLFEQDASTVALYDFSQPTGAKLRDVTGNGHDGAISSGVQWAPVLTAPSKISTSGGLALTVGEPVDLLAKVDPLRHIPRGRITKDGAGWTTSGLPDQYEAMMFPGPFPENYVVETVVTVLGPNDGMIQGLVAGNRQFNVTIDGFGNGKHPPDGMRSAVETIDRNRPHDKGRNYPCVLFGRLLTTDKPANLRYVVLADRVVVECDGRTVLDWKEMQRLGMHGIFSVNDPRALFWGAWGTKTRLSKFEFRPVLAINGAPPPGARILGDPVVTVEGTPATVASTGNPALPAEVPTPKVVEKAALPDKARLDKADAEVEAFYKQDFSGALKPAERIAVAEKLLKAASDETDPAILYKLLDKARTQKLKAGEIAGAFQIVDRLTAAFSVDPWQVKLDSLEEGAKAANKTQDRKDLIKFALRAGDAALADGHVETALKVADIASAAGKNLSAASDNDVKKAVRALQTAVEEAQKQAVTAQAAAEKLKSEPDDPNANLEWGRFVALVKRDWPTGLPLLAKGQDGELKAAATLDLAAPEENAKQIDLADAWFKAASAATAIREKESLLLRSRDWYAKALPGVSGLSEKIVRTQLDKIAELLPKDEDDSESAAPIKVNGGTGGMIGRVQVTVGKDVHFATVLIKCDPGATIDNAKLRQKLAVNKIGGVSGNSLLRLEMAGLLRVTEPTKVMVQQSGGSANGTGIVGFEDKAVKAAEVGGAGKQQATAPLSNTMLRPGKDYKVGWVLSGTDLGACQLSFINEKTGEPLTVFYDDGLEKFARSRGPVRGEIRFSK